MGVDLVTEESVRRVSVNFGGMRAVSVRVVGQGRPLLLLHGGAGPFSDDIITALQPAGVVAPDLPGFGESPFCDDWQNVTELADLGVGILDELGIAQADVVGHSFGSYIAAELASRFGSRLRRLVLSGPMGIWAEGIILPEVFALRPVELASLLGYPPPDDPDAFTPAETARREVLARFLFAQPFDRSLLRRLRCVVRPTLVLRGSEDRYVSSDYAKVFVDALLADYVELAGLPHEFPQVAPEVFARAVHAFLDQE
jgi:pimeloyl-ACP methyl ester carboxylesterase